MDDAGEIVVEHLSTETAFELVAHETRLAILKVLNTADQPLAFGELRNRVSSSQMASKAMNSRIRVVESLVVSSQAGIRKHSMPILFLSMARVRNAMAS